MSPNITLVQALCTVVAFAASIPLLELFFFHIILIRKVSLLFKCFCFSLNFFNLYFIRHLNSFNEFLFIVKGITTYEYVVAMRSHSEPPGISAEGDPESIPSSPTSSTATALSGGSSLGLHYKGAWCTPPRIFVDQVCILFLHILRF